MNWGLLAGALSRGIGDTFAGANQGLVQGEEIRRGRAREALEGQYLQMSQQQMLNHLAQQAVQNTLAQQRLGLEFKRMGQTQGYYDWLREQGQSDLALRRAADARAAAEFPVKLRRESALAAAYEDLPGFRAEQNRIREDNALAARAATLQRLRQGDRRLDLYSQRLGAMTSDKMTPQQKHQASALQTKMRNLRQALALAMHAIENGQKPLQDPYEIEAALDDVMQQYEDMQVGAAGATAPPAGGGQDVPAPVTPESLRKKYGL